MKKIALLNSFFKGGKTLLEYFKRILPNLKNMEKCSVDIFQPDNKDTLNLSISEAENYLQNKVWGLKIFQQGNSFYLRELFNYDYIFFNDFRRICEIPENIFTAAIMHGISPLLNNHKNGFATYLAYADFILCSSKSQLKQCVDEIIEFRKTNITATSKITFDYSKRDNARKTYLCYIQPLKKSLLSNDFASIKNIDKNNFTIGIMPSSSGVFPGISLYNSINLIVEELHKNFTSANIIFRPFFTESVAGLDACLNNLEKHIANFKIDKTNQSSTEFYQQCDILITDFSTGGISFLINKFMPPIYYILRKFTKHINVKKFIELQTDKVLFANSIKELIKQINFCINLTKEQRINYFDNYCKKDLFLHVDNQQVLQNIINKNFDNFPYVDAQGNIIFPRDFPKIF